MHTVTSKDGTTIAYETSGHGPALILVDGALCYRDFGPSKDLATLLSNDFAVYTYDRRGRGESGDTAPYAAMREIEDIDALIAQAGGSAFVYGISSGAVLALRAAVQLGADKVRKLALYEPLFNPDDDAEAVCDDKLNNVKNQVKADTEADILASFLSGVRSAKVLEELKCSPAWPLMKAIRHTLAYENALIDDDEIPTDVAKFVTMPTLVIDGSASLAVIKDAAKALHEAIPTSQYRTLKRQTTNVSAEAITPLLKSFFSVHIYSPQQRENYVQGHKSVQRIFG